MNPATIVSTREFKETPERIFRAFSDPSILASWWGPNGATNTFERFDFRPGGIWRFTMRMADGASYPMEREFVEITKPSRIVMVHKQSGHDFTQTIDIAETEDGTRLTWNMKFESEEEAQRVRAIIEEKNEENFDRLEAALAKT